MAASPSLASKESMMKKCSVVSRDEASLRRKKKSILEILGLNGEGVGHNKPFDEKANAEADPSGIAAGGVKRRGRKRKASTVAENDGSEIKEVSKVPVTSEAKVGVSKTSQGPCFRERKKSKYLSPPFTSVNKCREKKDKDDDHLVCTLPIFEAKVDDPLTKVSETSGVVGDKTAEQNEVRDAALVDPAQVKEARTVSDDAEMFLPLCRTSVFHDGPNYKNSSKCKPGWRRKFPEMELPSTVEGAPIMESPDHKEFSPKSDANPRKKRATEDMTPKSKASAKDDVRWLLITFKQSCPLPTKEDLIVVYPKYGNFNKNETVVDYNSKYALVVFKKISDAEVALKCSRAASPFRASGAEFELLRANSTPYCTSAQQQQPNIPRKQGRPKKVAVAEPPTDTGDTSKVQSLKQKLEKISSVLDESRGKLSRKVKSHLKDEIEGLLEFDDRVYSFV